jgi:hypothetical protein
MDGRKLETEPVTGETGPAGDDGVHCGNGIKDAGELCDIAIPAGEPDACPTTCEPFDACHEGKLDARGCQSKCIEGAPIDC